MPSSLCADVVAPSNNDAVVFQAQRLHAVDQHLWYVYCTVVRLVEQKAVVVAHMERVQSHMPASDALVSAPVYISTALLLSPRRMLLQRAG